MNFIGEKCSACGIEITEDDSVIVCPDCGSPHHRDCYLRYNNCANEEYHATGKKWKRAVVEPKKEIILCSSCGAPNPEDAENCCQCGETLGDNDDISEDEEYTEETIRNLLGSGKPYLGFDPEEDLGGATVKEVLDFVNTNTIYYLPIFKRMKDIGSKISFNITCLFFPSLYFANRKMWHWAIIAVIFSVILAIPSTLLLIAEYAENGTEGIPESLVALIQNNSAYLGITEKLFSFLQLCMNFLFCFLGNRMYFKYVIHTVNKIKKHGGSITTAQLGTVGGIKPVNMLFIILIKFGFSLFLFAMIGSMLCI